MEPSLLTPAFQTCSLQTCKDKSALRPGRGTSLQQPWEAPAALPTSHPAQGTPPLLRLPPPEKHMVRDREEKGTGRCQRQERADFILRHMA